MHRVKLYLPAWRNTRFQPVQMTAVMVDQAPKCFDPRFYKRFQPPMVFSTALQGSLMLAWATQGAVRMQIP